MIKEMNEGGIRIHQECLEPIMLLVNSQPSGWRGVIEGLDRDRHAFVL
jgi:hypothetical protein